MKLTNKSLGNAPEVILLQKEVMKNENLHSLVFFPTLNIMFDTPSIAGIAFHTINICLLCPLILYFLHHFKKIRKEKICKYRTVWLCQLNNYVVLFGLVFERSYCLITRVWMIDLVEPPSWVGFLVLSMAWWAATGLFAIKVYVSPSYKMNQPVHWSFSLRSTLNILNRFIVADTISITNSNAMWVSPRCPWPTCHFLTSMTGILYIDIVTVIHDGHFDSHSYPIAFSCSSVHSLLV